MMNGRRQYYNEFVVASPRGNFRVYHFVHNNDEIRLSDIKKSLDHATKTDARMLETWGYTPLYRSSALME